MHAKFLKLPELSAYTAFKFCVTIGAFRIAHATRTDYIHLEKPPLVRFASQRRWTHVGVWRISLLRQLASAQFLLYFY